MGQVAIKQLYSSFIDPHDLAEFSREVTLLHRLKHPHVLTFYGISRREMYCFIVTEFCPYALDAVLARSLGAREFATAVCSLVGNF